VFTMNYASAAGSPSLGRGEHSKRGIGGATVGDGSRMAAGSNVKETRESQAQHPSGTPPTSSPSSPARRNKNNSPNPNPSPVRRELPPFFKAGPWVEAALPMLLESPPHARPDAAVAVADKNVPTDTSTGTTTTDKSDPMISTFEEASASSSPTPAEASAAASQSQTSTPRPMLGLVQPSKSMRELTSVHLLNLSPTVDVCDHVYLLPRPWMSQWLQWAAHYHLETQAQQQQRRNPWKQHQEQEQDEQEQTQTSPPGSGSGGEDVNDVMRQVCKTLDYDYDTIVTPDAKSSHAAAPPPLLPGPIDARPISQCESSNNKRLSSCLLQPNIVVGRGGRVIPSSNPSSESESASVSKLGCCAVSEAFYNHAKSVHGVMCADGEVMYSQQSQVLQPPSHQHQPYHQQSKKPLPSYATTLSTVNSIEPPSSMCGTIPDIASWATSAGVIGTNTGSSALMLKDKPPPPPPGTTVTAESATTTATTTESSAFIHHHSHAPPHKAAGKSDVNAKQLIEFRRRVLFDFINPKETRHCAEVYPVAFHYQIIGNNSTTPNSKRHKSSSTSTNGAGEIRANHKNKGHFLVSRETSMVHAMKSLVAHVCPLMAANRKRCWVQYSLPGSRTFDNDNDDEGEGVAAKTRRDKYGTASELSDGYELWTDVVSPYSTATSSSLTVGEYLVRYVPDVSSTSVGIGMAPTTQLNFHMLVETRPPAPDVTSTQPRPPPPPPFTARAKHELARRIQVGDFVDAQDSAGNWYEAIVRDVRPQDMRVHFLGWSSRWDVTLPRVPTYMKQAKKKLSPAPTGGGPATPSRAWSNVLQNGGSRGTGTSKNGNRDPSLLASKTASLNAEFEMLAIRVSRMLMSWNIYDIYLMLSSCVTVVVILIHVSLARLQHVIHIIQTTCTSLHNFLFAKYKSSKHNYQKPAPPAPLWSRTNQWRYLLKLGDSVEVRQVSSLVKRPKWFTGTVLAFREAGDEPIEGGATLETLEEDENDPTNKIPLKLLSRHTQVLLEVMQEKAEGLKRQEKEAASATGEEIVEADHAVISKFKSSDIDDGEGEDNDAEPDADTTAAPPVPNPPYIRWVDLYGEEICKMYTHNERPKLIRPKAAGEDQTFGSSISRRGHGSGFPSLSRGGNVRGEPYAPGSVGLQNLGNSCYLNSILQCLNHLPCLTSYFIDGSYMKDLNEDNPLGSGGKVASAYAQHVSEVWSGDFQVLAPRNLKMTVGFFAPQFSNTYQHDSQEFLSFLMDGLHEDLNRIQDKPYVEDLEATADMKDDDVALESWRRHLLRHDSIVVDRCQGMHRSHVTCPDCHYQSVKFDVYSTISLPIPAGLDENDMSKTAIPLEECLAAFTSEEELDDDNAWYCNMCKKHVCAKKRISLWSTPDVLVFHLKRFQYESHSKIKSRILKSKVDTPVDYPTTTLDMGPYLLGPVDPESPPLYKVSERKEEICDAIPPLERPLNRI
jgi:ubiquitin carboxyl-terminal hydrolase 8